MLLIIDLSIFAPTNYDHRTLGIEKRESWWFRKEALHKVLETAPEVDTKLAKVLSFFLEVPETFLKVPKTFSNFGKLSSVVSQVTPMQFVAPMESKNETKNFESQLNPKVYVSQNYSRKIKRNPLAQNQARELGFLGIKSRDS